MSSLITQKLYSLNQQYVVPTSFDIIQNDSFWRNIIQILFQKFYSLFVKRNKNLPFNNKMNSCTQTEYENILSLLWNKCIN